MLLTVIALQLCSVPSKSFKSWFAVLGCRHIRGPAERRSVQQLATACSMLAMFDVCRCHADVNSTSKSFSQASTARKTSEVSLEFLRTASESKVCLRIHEPLTKTVVLWCFYVVLGWGGLMTSTGHLHVLKTFLDPVAYRVNSAAFRKWANELPMIVRSSDIAWYSSRTLS